MKRTGLQLPHSLHILYDLIFVVLSLASVGLIFFEITHELAAYQVEILNRIDILIALIFLLDFSVGFLLSDNRSRFFRRRWYELLASIPLHTTFVQSLRAIRIIRVLRIIEVIRVIRAAARIKRMGEFVVNKASYQLFSLIVVVMTLIFSGALAFHAYEFGTNPNVHRFFDSFWWAMVTASSVGYGDIYPVTTAGRIVAMGLMVVGIGSLGTLTAGIAGYVMESQQRILKNDDISE